LSREQEGWHNDGMSLRDWFAGQALAGLLSGLPPGGEIPDPQLAGECYRAADAMLRERKRSTTEKSEGVGAAD
jgi:hypothetical protein